MTKLTRTRQIVSMQLQAAPEPEYHEMGASGGYLLAQG